MSRSFDNMTGPAAYIVEMGQCLPNSAVDNDAVEQVLGMVSGRPSRAKRLTLHNNGIRTRHYAIDASTGRMTHNNAQLTALAVSDALTRADWRIADLDLLVCGTATPDQLIPAHAQMTHGELGGARLEAVSIAGVCGAGMAALKYAALSVRSGDIQRAVSTGSELVSNFIVARNFTPESSGQIDAAERRPGLAFEKDFLRWMLSDGAGAALVAAAPIAGRRALRIDWIESISLANELPVCMYSGAIREPDGRLRGWREAPSPGDAAREHYFAIKQDARLLDDLITRLVTADTIGAIAARRGLTPKMVDWFVPHYSSEYFKPKLANSLSDAGFTIAPEHWFSNLSRVGNVGSAAIYLMLEELLHTNRISAGERILCFVPESARFSVYFMLLTVV